MSSIGFTLSLSLFDSLSTAQQIIVFVLLLTTAKPIRNALWYLAGLSGSYFACGVVGYLALDRLRVFLGRFFPSTTDIPGAVYYQTEFWTGVVMTVLGFWYFAKKRNAPPNRAENMFLAKLKSMNAAFAFGIGVFISVTSFPVSIPYLVALGKYATLQMGISEACVSILLYNVGYASPMIGVMAVYLWVRRGADDVTDGLHERARRLNVQLTTWTLAGVGIFAMIDAGCYFTIGHALLKGRYF